MPKVKAKIVKWISDEPQPGIVETQIEDAEGKVWVISDKASVVSAEEITAETQLPVDTLLECEVLNKNNDSKTARISLKPWGLETVNGIDEFTINQTTLVD